MKVILNDHVDNLGERGEAVAVKPGYARNYLIPKGFAYPDTPGNRRRFEEEQTHWEEMDLQRRSAADKLASDLDGTELLFERRAGENDVLFGSVSVVDIARELAERGFDLDRKRIHLEDAVKAIGTFKVPVRVYRENDVTITVHVVRPGEKPGAAEGPSLAEVTDVVGEEAGVTERVEPTEE